MEQVDSKGTGHVVRAVPMHRIRPTSQRMLHDPGRVGERLEMPPTHRVQRLEVRHGSGAAGLRACGRMFEPERDVRGGGPSSDVTLRLKHSATGPQSRCPRSVSDLKPLYPVSRRHLEALTDATGIMQHALGRRPNPEHGYCTDDVSRSLTVDLLHGCELGWAAVSPSAWRSYRFLVDAFESSTGRFRNFRAIDGTWLDSPGSEDAHARAVLALAESMVAAPEPGFREAASALFARALPATLELRALRPRSSALLACAAALRAGGMGEIVGTYEKLAVGLREAFETGSVPAGWPWPEPVLTYENALLARAMITGGTYLGAAEMVHIGCRVLDWLIEAQTADDGHLTPIGNKGWWPRDGTRARFDQQPIEATALLLAAEAAWETTHADRYRRCLLYTSPSP